MSVSVMNQIESRQESLTKLQKRIANFVMSDPIQAAFMTVDQLSHAVGVSTATVVRFSTELGYNGYTEFQRELQEYLKNRAKPSSKLKLSIESKSIGHQKQDLMTTTTQLVLENIERTFEGLSAQNLETIADKILHSEKIYCAGLRTSFCVSSYLGYNLNRMLDAPCIVCGNIGDLPEQIRRITDKDVVFAITMSRYSRQIVEFAKLAKRKNATVIAFSDEHVSPLSGYSDYQMIAKAASAGFHNSVVAFCYLVDILLSICCRKDPEQINRNLKASEQVLYDTNFMIEN